MSGATLKSRSPQKIRGSQRHLRRAPRRPMRPGDLAAYLVAVLLIGLMLAPVIYIILGGFRTNSQITLDPSGFPDPWVIGNYIDVMISSNFWRQIFNSAVIATGTALGAVFLGLMVSYVLAWYKFRSRGAMYAFFAAGLMFPITVAITPLYIVIKNLGLMNSMLGVILPQIAFSLPVTIIILVPFLRAIPPELREASFIDGLGRVGFFWRMVVRLSMPGVITTGILAFVGSWNAYLLPLFLLNSEASYTLPLGVANFSSQYSVDTARVLAFTSLSMIPALIFFSIFERRIVGGLTGAVKG